MLLGLWIDGEHRTSLPRHAPALAKQQLSTPTRYRHIHLPIPSVSATAIANRAPTHGAQRVANVGRELSDQQRRAIAHRRAVASEPAE